METEQNFKLKSKRSSYIELLPDLAIFGLILFALTILRRLFRTFIVNGDSMSPTLCENDRLLGLSYFRLRLNDIVVFNHPISSDKLIKRVKSIEGNRITVIGDNPVVSVDSYVFGPIELQSIVYKIIYRYFPFDRAGRLKNL